jgi:hypothetical protein
MYLKLDIIRLHLLEQAYLMHLIYCPIFPLKIVPKMSIFVKGLSFFSHMYIVESVTSRLRYHVIKRRDMLPYTVHTSKTKCTCMLVVSVPYSI